MRRKPRTEGRPRARAVEQELVVRIELGDEDSSRVPAVIVAMRPSQRRWRR